MNGVGLLNLQIMSPANTDRSKKGFTDGDRRKKRSLQRQQQP